MTGTLVIGVGHRDRGDDGAGLEVARRVRQRCGAGVTVLEADGEASRLMEAWSGQSRVVVVDAAASGQKKPGSIWRLDGRKGPLPTRRFASTSHGWGLAEAVAMAESLGALPESLVVYGIEGRSFSTGAGLSAEVEASIDEVVERVLGEGEARRRPRP